MEKKSKKVFKIVSGVFIFLTLPSLLFFAFLFFKYDEDLPNGVQGKEADALAYKMLKALDYEAFNNTDYIEWTFKKRHHYQWDKVNNICEVYWEDFKVSLDLNDHTQNKAFVHSFKAESDISKGLIKKATKYFKNDSFWLVAPYRVFNKDAERRLVILDNGDQALLVTFSSGGLAPGDSYLWLLDNSGKPTAFKMWTSKLPIDGLKATWSDWMTTESGAQLPTFHKLLILGLEINHIKSE
ncbi:hypothetical protein Q4Q35_04505 [Flavivirga aquimarina]|uniref:Uncharacterized protein n=1 Tax=Flavivirga aquimarina TaxID=2027862 RepID=A0ABT8W7J2_9FLAO|nr:hypothetical protein [Flavivirga aquimarina]MDO5969061.1 hypothetical protein [Flavivirga aquimarina]